jgi:transglutaminase-like putative cysteine protease
MKYRITHTTIYNYSQAVGLCQNEARLQPRNFGRQQCTASYFEITPAPMDYRELVDFFGNRLAYFAIQKPHKQLLVTAISEVDISPKPQTHTASTQMSWEEVKGVFQEAYSQNLNPQQIESTLAAKQYVLDSPMITTTAELSDYAKPSFRPNRALIEVVTDLMGRIYHDFIYDPASTTIATPLSEVLANRRGVCQDFAHLAIACLRSFGIPARYVSGYLETLPAPGKPRLVGADASHAWFAVYIPDQGWLDFDPTNNKMPHDQHITLAWGRDYADVTPLKGIAFGGGQHTLSVSVDVLRLDF